MSEHASFEIDTPVVFTAGTVGPPPSATAISTQSPPSRHDTCTSPPGSGGNCTNRGATATPNSRRRLIRRRIPVSSALTAASHRFASAALRAARRSSR